MLLSQIQCVILTLTAQYVMIEDVKHKSSRLSLLKKTENKHMNCVNLHLCKSAYVILTH